MPNQVAASVPLDELDIVGIIDDMSRTEAGQKTEQAYGDDVKELGYVMNEKGQMTNVPLMVPLYVKEMQKIFFNEDDFASNGQFTLKVANRIKNAKDHVAEAKKIGKPPDCPREGLQGAGLLRKSIR